MTAKRRDFKHYGKIRHPARRIVGKTVLFVCIAFLFTTVLTAFFLDSVSIGSASMEPTLSHGEKVLISSLVFGPRVPFTAMRFRSIREPERGELVVCSPPFHRVSKLRRLVEPFISFFTLRRTPGAGAGAGNTDWDSATMIKRIIGVPGDTVLLENFIAFIKPAGEDKFINERVLSSSQYSVTLTPLPKDWDPSFPFSGTTAPLKLGENEYFVLGDNRSQSHDSRHFGPVTLDNITGKVLFRFHPLRKAGAT